VSFTAKLDSMMPVPVSRRAVLQASLPPPSALDRPRQIGPGGHASNGKRSAWHRDRDTIVTPFRQAYLPANKTRVDGTATSLVGPLFTRQARVCGIYRSPWVRGADGAQVMFKGFGTS
jgi:hypothetical protein